MTFDPARIQQSKREFRQLLAARPIGQKLAMLDALRERALAKTKLPERPDYEAGNGFLLIARREMANPVHFAFLCGHDSVKEAS